MIRGPCAEGDGTLDHAFELADVAGPVVALQHLEGVAGEADDVLAKLLGEPGRKCSASSSMSVPRVPQRGQHQADGADPVVEVLAEPSLLDQRRQVIAGGQHESHVRARLHARRARPTLPCRESAARAGAEAGVPARGRRLP